MARSVHAVGETDTNDFIDRAVCRWHIMRIVQRNARRISGQIWGSHTQHKHRYGLRILTSKRPSENYAASQAEPKKTDHRRDHALQLGEHQLSAQNGWAAAASPARTPDRSYSSSNGTVSVMMQMMYGDRLSRWLENGSFVRIHRLRPVV